MSLDAIQSGVDLCLKQNALSQCAGERFKILHIYKVFYPEVFGGIPYAIRKSMNIRRDVFDHQLLVCCRDPAIQKKKIDGVERVWSFGNVMSLPIAPSYPFRLWRRLREVDVAVLHAPFPLADLVFALRFAPETPLIVFWHSDIVRQKFFGWLLRPVIRRTLTRASKILVSDKAVVSNDSLISSFPEKIEEIAFPVDSSRFDLNLRQKDKVEQLKKRYPSMVLAVGRLVAYKGFDILIAAAKSVNATFCIIGEGPNQEALQAQIKQLKLEDRVFLLGALSDEDLVLYLSAATIFALPSVSNAETFGVSQLEALAAGRAIVNTNLPTAVPHVARHGIEAVTVAPGKPDEFARAIVHLLNEPAIRKQFEAAARTRAQYFSEQSFSEKYFSILQSVRKPTQIPAGTLNK